MTVPKEYGKIVLLALDEETHRRLKITAFHRGKTIQAFLRGLVKTVVYANESVGVPPVRDEHGTVVNTKNS